ncbi:MAG TPA: response regulator, partial [Flavipsychrobacter sp.]|nr:response regulator [Flavipsychrobacter sp.]
MENTNKIKVLFIDDEVNNLVGFKASFRKDFEVLLAGSAHEGLQMVNEHPDLHVIICDQRMQDMTGVDFFEKIVLTHPDPVRILATGYTDIEAVVNAIN